MISMFSPGPVFGSSAVADSTSFGAGQSTEIRTVFPKVLSIRQSNDNALLLPAAIAGMVFLICIVKLLFCVSPGLIVTLSQVNNFAFVLPMLAFLSFDIVPPPGSKMSAYSRTSPMLSVNV